MHVTLKCPLSVNRTKILSKLCHKLDMNRNDFMSSLYHSYVNFTNIFHEFNDCDIDY